MPFPEFEPGKKRILLFSRGRGRGHATPDIAILRALHALRGDLEVRAVSYGTGADTFREAGVSVVDLGLPDAGGVVDISVLAGRLIGWLDPDLVVSHEEFPAIPAAKIFDKPTLVLTDWFLESEGYAMNSLKFADEILFLGTEGVFWEPAWLHDRISYVGHMLRPFDFGPGDRLRALAQLGIPAEAIVLSVFPGSWTEAKTPLLAPVLQAFDALGAVEKRLIWLAGADYSLIQSALAARKDVMVVPTCQDIDRLMVASSVAITKTNRKTVFELQHLGVPTIAVTYGLNPGDDLAVAALKSVVRIPGGGLTGARLSGAVVDLMEAPRTERGLRFCSPRQCAERMIRALDGAVMRREDLSRGNQVRE